MIMDSELEEWRRRWRAQPAVPPELFRKVERDTANLHRFRIAEVLATLFLGGGTVVWALVRPSVNSILLAVITCVAIGIAWVFSLQWTRGIWAASASTTSAYLDLSVRRCRWKMRDARYDSVQSLVLTAVVVWISHGMVEDFGGTQRPLWLYAVLFVVIASSLMAHFESKRRKARAELDQWLAIKRQIETD